MVFITSYLSGQRRTIVVHCKNDRLNNSDNSITCEDIFDTLYKTEGTCNGVYLTCNGKPVYGNEFFRGDENVIATLQLKGGKGGFGSMLRAIGAQIEKTTNREACRDLSGRRLRDINEEKRLKDFLAKKVETEKEKLEIKRKKLQQLKEGPKHTFEDKSYFEQREKREKDIFDSLDKAFASGKNSQDKIFKPTLPEKNKNVKARMLDDLDESSDDDSSDDDDDTSMGEENKKEEKDRTSASSTASSSSSSSPTPSDNVYKNGEKREIESNHEDEHINKKLKTDQ